MEFSVLPDLPVLQPSSEAAIAYCQRYGSLFPDDLLSGKRIGVYEHSSAGRDLYAPLLRQLGAEVITLERSDEFSADRYRSGR